MSTLLRIFVGSLILAQVVVAEAGLFGTGSSSGKVAWLTDMKKAGQESKRTGKPILVQLTAPWCSYCHKMLKETFTDPAVAKRVNESFIPLLLDADENEQVVEMLQISSFPSTIIVSAEMDELGRISGFQKADAFNKKLTEFAPAGRAQVAQASNVESTAAPQTRVIEAPPVGANQPTRNPIGKPAQPTNVAPSAPDTKVLNRRAQDLIAASETQTTATTEVTNNTEAAPRLPLPLPDFPPQPKPNLEATAASEATDSTSPDLVPANRQSVGTPLRAAFEGMCLVSMLEDREPTPGRDEFSLMFRGQRLHFRDAQQLEKFKADPNKYWPWFDGRCPVATRHQETVLMGRPQFGGAYRQRLIFFRDAEHRVEFSKDPRGYIMAP